MTHDRRKRAEGRETRTRREGTVLCVLRADLPRLRSVLDTYSHCMTELMTTLSGPAVSSDRLAVVERLRRDHDAVLVDLSRLVDLLEGPGSAASDEAPTGGLAAERGGAAGLGVVRGGRWRDRAKRPVGARRRRSGAQA
ncbi:hypothetical protein [Rhodoplanes azumiensis]|uniref:Uncharacterized protein n=1 Tax=Rhodoplanes azumiensis TaxID=1897628 RepID=A0ABW5AQ43_9BRAD